MTRRNDREKAIRLRLEGKTYTEIKDILHIGKGTLSSWLRDMPLTAVQLHQVRDMNPRRIEKFRATMKKKSDMRFERAYEQAKKDIGRLTKRDLFIAGIYLYWGEGTKAERGGVSITNTDPAVIRTFLSWATMMNFSREDLYVRLHLYSDMDVKKETEYWSNELSIAQARFRKVHIKKSQLSNLTYKNGFGHGTCSIKFENMSKWEYIMMALKRVRELHIRP